MGGEGDASLSGHALLLTIAKYGIRRKIMVTNNITVKFDPALSAIITGKYTIAGKENPPTSCSGNHAKNIC